MDRARASFSLGFVASRREGEGRERETHSHLVPSGHPNKIRLELRRRMVSIFFFLIYFFLAAPRGMRDLSSLTREQTHVPYTGSMEFSTTEPPGKCLILIR